MEYRGHIQRILYRGAKGNEYKRFGMEVSKEMREITSEEFRAEVFDYKESPVLVNKTGRPIVIDFFADWCQPCKMVTPILEEIDEETSEVDFMKVDTETEIELASAFNIQALPTILFIPVEGEPKLIMGAAPKDIITEAIQDIFFKEA